MEPCPYCPPPWAHEHVGDTRLPLLIIVRDVAQLKEWHFHGTQRQCDEIVKATDHGPEPFEQLLLQYKNIDKALRAFHA